MAVVVAVVVVAVVSGVDSVCVVSIFERKRKLCVGVVVGSAGEREKQAKILVCWNVGCLDWEERKKKKK